MCASTQEEEWLVGNGKREIAPQQEMPGTKWEMGNGKLDVEVWNRRSGKWEMGSPVSHLIWDPVTAARGPTAEENSSP